ncbi:hypothetical protein XENOCAPTIV_014976 [Xenoophorus captivus]|uniref:Myomegalin-like n=1 Tax=Xenoophorus captivus TaxID=1517983 RepID=A0ABV0RJD8_9TELE
MAPLWKTMLSRSSPLYRDALFSFSLWEWKAQERELLLLKKHTDQERRAMLTQLDKLSKELQQKDKVIESLQAELKQHQGHHRSDTPSSSHALSDITDQSDRISYVSDEHGSTNEDLVLCSDPDAASEIGLQGIRTSTKASTGLFCKYSSVPHLFSSAGFSSPQSRSLHGFPFAHQHPGDPSGSLPLSYQGFQPSPFSSSSLGGNMAMKAGASLLERSALWEMPFGSRPARAGADLSSGSSGYQSGTSHTGPTLAYLFQLLFALLNGQRAWPDVETLLQHEASVLRQQLDQNRSLIQTLQNELQEANRRVCEATANTHSGHSNRKDVLETESYSQKEKSGAPDGSFTSRHGHPAVSHVKDFKALQQQLLEGTFLVIQMEDALCSLNTLQRLHQPFDPGCVRNLLSDTKTLKQILQEAESLLQVTCRAGLSDPQETKQDESLIDEVVSLRLKLSEQEQALKDAMERLRTSNLTKDSMEQFIVSQLSRTRDVLKKAKTNLQENKLRISSLHQASVTVPPPSPSPLSSPQFVKGTVHPDYL